MRQTSTCFVNTLTTQLNRGNPSAPMSVARSPRAKTAPSAPAEEANRRDALIRASAQLFREKGFNATTVRDIAAAVGMRSGSPFYHFGNKEEILKAVMEEGLRQGYERSTAALAQASTPSEQFRALVRTHYGILHDEGSEFIAVLLYDWRSLPEAYKRDIIAVKDRYDGLWHTTLAALLQQGLLGANSAQGALVPGDEKVARLMVLGAINFSVTWFKQQPDNPKAMDLDTLSERTVRFFLKAA